MNNQANSKKFFNSIHRYGMIASVLSIAAFFFAPLVICLRYDIMPNFVQLFPVVFPLLIATLPAYIGEIVSEVPLLGSSYYLASVSGNVIAHKIPAAINALELTGVEQGTTASDAIVGLAVASVSITATVIIAIGVALMTPLQPVLRSEFVTVAADYVLPALFGFLSLGFFRKRTGSGATVHGNLLALLVPFVIAGILYLFVMPTSYSSKQGWVILGSIVVLFIVSRIMYKTGIIRVDLPETLADKPAE